MVFDLNRTHKKLLHNKSKSNLKSIGGIHFEAMNTSQVILTSLLITKTSIKSFLRLYNND